jgi:hypothetical protein
VVNRARRKTSETNGLSEHKVLLLNKSPLQKNEKREHPKATQDFIKNELSWASKLK